MRNRIVGAALLALSFLTSACASSDSAKIGIYHWGGVQTQSMTEGVERIASLGGTVARVTLSPRYFSDYGISGQCYPDYSLVRLAEEADVSRALDHPGISVFMLTAYDGVSFGDCYAHRYLNPAAYTPAFITAMRREYVDFVVYLCKRFRGSGRQFIISNWEADNAIYCGEAFSYAINEAFRTTCDAKYPVYYSGNASPAQSLEGLALWLRAREEAIREGMAEARELGLTGVEVVHAPEICNLQMLEQNGFRSVLRTVLPQVRPEFVSYSAYESLNAEDPEQSMGDAVAMIRSVSGASHVIIGEAGYSSVRWGREAGVRLQSAVGAALHGGAMLVFVWNLNEGSGDTDYGLFDTSDRVTPLGLVVERMLRQ